MTRRIVIALIVLVGIPAVLLALPATEAGSRWLLGMASRLAGDRFSYASVEGDLLSRIRFADLEVRAAGHHTRAGELIVSWRPRALLSGRVHVQRFSLSRADHAAPGAETDAAAGGGPPAELSMPVAVQIDTASVEDVVIRRGVEQTRVERILVDGFHMDGAIVTLNRLEVAADTLNLVARGNVDASPPHRLEADVAWSLRRAGEVVAEGNGNLRGNLDGMRVEHTLEKPFSLDVSGTVAPLADPVSLDLSGRWTSLRWPLDGQPDIVSESGHFNAKGTLAELALTLDASVDSDAVPARSVRVRADVKRRLDDFQASVQWSAELTNGEAAAGSGSVGGNARAIRIDHSLEKPARIITRGRIGLAGDAPELALHGEWRELSWPLTAAPQVRSDSGSYRLSGTPEALRIRMAGGFRAAAARIEHMDLELEGEAAAAAPFPFDVKLNVKARSPGGISSSGRATLKGDARNIELDAAISAPWALTVKGAIGLAGDRPEIDLRGGWRDARWPLSAAPELRSETGTYTVSGSADRIQVQLEAITSGPRVPSARLRLGARVTPENARIQSLVVNTLDGEIRATGSVGWQPAAHWNLEVSASGLNPGRYFSEWPGTVSLETRATGRLDDGTPTLGVEGLKVDGRLRGYPFKARGNLSVHGARVSVSTLEVLSGDNRVAVRGEAGDRLNLSFTVDAPALSAVAPGLQGGLKGKGKLTGARARPQIAATLSGNALAFEDHAVASLELDMDAGLAPAYASRIALNAEGVRAGGTSLGRVSLSGEGTPEAHRLALELSPQAATVSIRAEGSYGAGGWTGTLAPAIRGDPFGEWRAQDPARLTASGEQLKLEGLCLAQAQARVCASGRWQASGGAIEADGEITKLPLTLARPFLPPGMRVNGTLNADFKAGGTLDAPRLQGRILADAGTIGYEHGAGFEGTEFEFRDGHVDVRYSPGAARLQGSVRLDDVGSISGNVETGAWQGGRSPSLAGRIEADFSDLAWVGAMAPRLVDVRGSLSAAVNVGGTLADPALSGELTLAGGAVNVPDLGLELRKINFAVRGDDASRLTIDGSLSSGGGTLKLNGRSRFAGAERRIELDIKGTDFEAARLPTVHAYISPDLKLRANPQVAELTGNVHIPRATVRLKELPQTAVKVSEDEVIVNADKSDQREAPRPGPKVRIDVVLSLGDKVSFDGFGLATAIEGKLAVSGETGQPMQAQGTLSLRKGRYKAYGQDLKIQTGRLLFTGPLDNPGIDVTAVREVGEVTAGIVLSGTVKSVRSRVFSEPQLPEADAFSYLLTGGPVGAGSEADAAKLQSAAAALGLNRAQLVTQQIGNVLGLDQLSVGGDGVDQTSLLLGKQITPDLFVRYALGIFEQSGKLLLDYRLTDNVSVRAESGEQQGMDVIYKIEREKLF